MFHDEAQAAVVEQEFRSGLQDREDFRMRQVGAPRTARQRIEIEPKRLIRLEQHGPIGETSHAQLRTLQIRKDADRSAGLAFQLAQNRESCAMIIGAAMAEVQAEHVDAGEKQALSDFRRGTRRSHRRDDLGVTGTP
jgi:hypothetical protein